MTPATFTLALGAGMLATINPCAFVMLPALVSFYLGADDAGYTSRPSLVRLRDGMIFGVAVTVGFLTVFGVLGLIISIGAGAISAYLPWGTVVIGAGLILLGLWLFVGRHLIVGVSTLNARRESRSLPAMALYGVAYATASLSCTLPVFLVVVGTSLVAGPGRPLLFVVYGLGMGAVLTAVAVSAALFQGAIARYLRRIVPYVQQINALLLVAAGGYMLATELPVVI